MNVSRAENALNFKFMELTKRLNFKFVLRKLFYKTYLLHAIFSAEVRQAIARLTVNSVM